VYQIKREDNLPPAAEDQKELEEEKEDGEEEEGYQSGDDVPDPDAPGQQLQENGK